MATGAYDANGIWQYGEDDNIALFSDLLNLGTESTSDAFTDDRARIATLEAGNLSGIIPLKATAATFVTGTGAVNDLGTVTYTGVTKISLDGIFSANYRNYRIVNALVGTAGAQLQFRFRTGAGDISTASYGYQVLSSNSGTVSGGLGANVSNGRNGYISANERVSGITDFYNPNNALVTTWTHTGQTGEAYNLYTEQYSGVYSSTLQFTGISIYPATGNITGALTVYGWND